MGRNEVKQESSIPVQSRVSILTLAELEMYWDSQGYVVTTMSQLVSWSLDVLREALVANNKLPQQITSVADANNHLIERGLYQKSVRGRGRKKIGQAISFENLRNEGDDPQTIVPKQHKMMHKQSSVKTFKGKVESGLVNEALEKYKELFPEEGNIEVIDTRPIPARRKMTDEEFEAKRREIDAHDKAQDEAMNKWLEEQDRLKIERTNRNNKGEINQDENN